MLAKLIDGSVDVSFGVGLGAKSNVVHSSIVLLAKPASVLGFDTLSLLFDKGEILQARN